MIAVGSKVSYRGVKNGTQLAAVVAYVLAVHTDGSIDLGWRGDGGFHPDRNDRLDLELHKRTRVARLGIELAGDGVSPVPHERQYTAWEPL